MKLFYGFSCVIQKKAVLLPPQKVYGNNVNYKINENYKQLWTIII